MRLGRAVPPLTAALKCTLSPRSGPTHRHRQRDDTLQAQGIGHFATRASGPVVDVFAGSYNGFALTENHYVFAWGLNKNGQLGLDDEEDRDRPTEVPALRGLKVVAIAGGDFHTLVLTATGELYGYARAAAANAASCCA